MCWGSAANPFPSLFPQYPHFLQETLAATLILSAKCQFIIPFATALFLLQILTNTSCRCSITAKSSLKESYAGPNKSLKPAPQGFAVDRWCCTTMSACTSAVGHFIIIIISIFQLKQVTHSAKQVCKEPSIYKIKAKTLRKKRNVHI